MDTKIETVFTHILSQIDPNTPRYSLLKNGWAEYCRDRASKSTKQEDEVVSVANDLDAKTLESTDVLDTDSSAWGILYSSIAEFSTATNEAKEEGKHELDSQLFRELLLTALSKELEHTGDKIMRQITPELGSELSKQERKALNLCTSTLTYGEIHFSSFATLLSIVLDCGSGVIANPYVIPQVNKLRVFYDLGSGTGRALVAAALMHNFKEVRGIEYLESLHNSAVEVLKAYNEFQLSDRLPANAVQASKIEAICGDIFKYDWSDGDIVFANSTCFSLGMMKQIADLCKNLKTGTFIITYSTELHSPYLKTLFRREFKQSWGKCTVYIHIRVSDPTQEQLEAWTPPDEWLERDDEDRRRARELGELPLFAVAKDETKVDSHEDGSENPL